MQLRVRSLDGAEIVLAVAPLTVRVTVAEIKRRALAELRRLRETRAGLEPRPPVSDDAAEEHRSMAGASLAFRGQLLADADDVNLFALTPAEFFVMIEEEVPSDEDDGDEGGSADEETKESGDGVGNRSSSHSKRRKQTAKASGVDRGLAETVVMQLVEMGFLEDQAREATELARGELPRAIALLTGEVDASTMLSRSGGGSGSNASQSSRLRRYVDDLIRKYPELAAIESLLQNEQVHRLKQIATITDFEALVMLKEAFPAHWLAQMNENPSATALFLALPDEFETASVKPRQSKTTKSTKKVKTDKEEVNLTDESSTVGAHDARSTSKDQDAIDRLTAMGFASDLVAAIYESCGGNEELAANLLFETLQ